ncbi:MAG: substrate-binding domain-containing protein [Pseudomonadota bacterium]
MNTCHQRPFSVLATKVLGAVLLLASGAVFSQPLLMASTTSTEQSGLFAHLLPAFKAASGMDVKVVAVGTGQAIDMGRRGDADVLFVHDQAAEEKLVADGFATKRMAVMYNDFVLVGPAADPSGVRGKDIVAALRKAAAGAAPFVSRGDRSGTHVAELRYWKQADLDVSKIAGYRECGCGMGPALNIAASTGAYALTDRGTWLNFRNRAGLAVLVEGDGKLFNQYGVLPVNPARHPHVNAAGANRFVDWVTSPAGQAVIAGYRIGGEQLFFPNAKP